MRKTRNEGDIDALFLSYYIPLYRYVSARLPGETDVAQDILQDIFLTLARLGKEPNDRASFRSQSSPFTWLCAIAKRRIISHYRQALRGKKHFSETQSDSDQEPRACAGAVKSPEAELLDKETCERVRTCLTRLPVEQRFSLILKYIEGFSQRELARILGKSEKAVESILLRSRKAFRTLYSEGDPV